MPERRMDSDAGYTDFGRVIPLLRGLEYSITPSTEHAVMFVVIIVVITVIII